MEKIDLSGTWQLARVSDGSSRPIQVPGDIISALASSGEIPDPYYDRNELEVQWVGREDWLLEREIDIPARLLAKGRIFLRLEVLDTIAEVRVNGELLGRGENMFRPFDADARPLLKEGKNLLSVLIRSPERAAAELATALPYPIPHTGAPVSSPNRNLVRKAQCMSGWDWGPCLMTGGIYDGASLLAYEGARIEYATTGCRREGSSWLLTVTAQLSAPAACSLDLEARLSGGAQGEVQCRATRPLELPPGASTAVLELAVEGARPWWPAGYGEQSLYDLVVEASAGGRTLDAARKRIGLRELEVVSAPDEIGRSMTFRVNGREVFCKGADWIPADALPARYSRERLDDLLSSAVEANMNCVRVWGGGRYERDDFYELCDEKGILVWQDFMFACSMYPSNPAFLANVEAEARYQVRRLMDHPCIALWCGNNEDLGALGWYPESKENPMRYIVDYDRLNEGVLGRVVRELDPGRAWWPTSPCGGPDDFSDTWHSDGKGDMHFWSVWHEGKSFSEYLKVKPRFCSEFGFQAFPNPGTVASFAPEAERNVTSPTMEHHQKSNRGNSIIMETMTRYFRMPSGEAQTLYLSQVQQAWAIQTAVEYWRSLRPVCMGAIYWQLNDVWPVTSWSSLDYDGSWKLLHYDARRFFEPLHLALIAKDGTIRAVAVNDGLEAYGAELAISLRALDGSAHASYAAKARVAPEAATELWSMPIASLPCKPEEAFLDARLTLKPPSGASIERTAWAFLAEPKRYSLLDPGLEAKAGEDGDGAFIDIQAANPAFFVALWTEGPAGRFEDSGFYLPGGEGRRLRFLPHRDRKAPRAAELQKALRIIDLSSSYR